MENPLQSLADAVAELQAQALGNSTMIEAMLMAYPDPARLRNHWNAISAPRIASTSMDAVTKDRAADHATTWHLKKWAEKLDRYHPEED